jgi:hypothetical protein
MGDLTFFKCVAWPDGLSKQAEMFCVDTLWIECARGPLFGDRNIVGQPPARGQKSLALP